MSNLYGQRPLSPEAARATIVSDAINAVVGTTATLLTPPMALPNLLMVKAVQGGFNLRMGDHHSAGMPSTEFPAASVTDGSGGLHIAAGETITVSSPTAVTVAGYDSTSVLLYWWV